METTTIPERVVATITATSLPPHRFRVRCVDCDDGTTTSERAFAQGYAEAHVRRVGHTVEILDRQAPDAA